ncbi:uncharacterized protein ARMOST_06108 [Armillaria ostoyae]|uniref:Uncharacterized protein n=1 Tax=Armillaria ostoyae TaxID=47428 RepID=A0A284R262_ARMOS|nr:uncharacterized protein ARMOST_06108 [Armillaria ostoyae]
MRKGRSLFVISQTLSFYRLSPPKGLAKPMTSAYPDKPLQTPSTLFPPLPSHTCTDLVRILDWNEFTIADAAAAAAAWMDPRRKGRDYDQRWRVNELPTTITSFARICGFSDAPACTQRRLWQVVINRNVDGIIFTGRSLWCPITLEPPEVYAVFYTTIRRMEIAGRVIPALKMGEE